LIWADAGISTRKGDSLPFGRKWPEAFAHWEPLRLTKISRKRFSKSPDGESARAFAVSADRKAVEPDRKAAVARYR
jgi:hypothetical protein